MQLGALCANMLQIAETWCRLMQFGVISSRWYKLEQSGGDWWILVQFDAIWFSLVQPGAILRNLLEIG